MTLTGVSKTDAVGAAQRRLGAGTMLWVQSLCLTGLTPVGGKTCCRRLAEFDRAVIIVAFVPFLVAGYGGV